MTSTGRDIDQLLQEVGASLKVYENAGVGSVITTTKETVEETTMMIDRAIKDAREKRDRLDKLNTELDQYLKNLQANRENFLAQRKQHFETSSAQLYQLQAESLKPELVHKREQLLIMRKKLEESDQAEVVDPAVVHRARKVRALQSFGFNYEKVKHKSTEEVWGIVKDLWE